MSVEKSQTAFSLKAITVGESSLSPRMSRQIVVSDGSNSYKYGRLVSESLLDAANFVAGAMSPGGTGLYSDVRPQVPTKYLQTVNKTNSRLRLFFFLVRALLINSTEPECAVPSLGVPPPRAVAASGFPCGTLRVASRCYPAMLAPFRADWP